MNIIEAVEQLKVGKAIQRSNWGNAKFKQCSLKMDSIKFSHPAT